MNIWTTLREEVTFSAIEGEAIRVVESQEQVATNSLVDSLAEQSLLEEMLERSKPPLPADAEGLHYLPATPFVIRRSHAVHGLAGALNQVSLRFAKTGDRFGGNRLLPVCILVRYGGTATFFQVCDAAHGFYRELQ